MKTVQKDFVRQLIDFAPTEKLRRQGFRETQLEGTVAAYNMIARNRCAYLADEVGMGKTYMALGVMALVRYFNPRARIVVIAPRENIQRKWIKEQKNFVRTNWKVVGNRVKSIQGEPAWEPILCGSLLQFAHEVFLNADRDFFVRMTSFSLNTKDKDNRRRLRRELRKHVPWIDRSLISVRTPEEFRDAFGCAFNAVVPNIDLLVVDEAHNLKHGFSARGSIRNRVLGLSFGHSEGNSPQYEWYRQRVKNLLFLSATPFEEDYEAIQRQLEIFGFGNILLRDHEGSNPLKVKNLLNRNLPMSDRKEIVERLMLRRVSGLRIGGKLFTKNMYRREWRNGGYKAHDNPMEVSDLKQRLVVALMQKKVAEVLQDKRFNNQFQIGMLSSFESFLETLATASRGKQKTHSTEDGADDSVFDESQDADKDERQGIDSSAVAEVVESYRKQFKQSLPHPKLDATSAALANAFDSGEKTLVFVRRVRTVDELAAKLDAVFDGWIHQKMVSVLPNLTKEINKLFAQYERERLRRPEDRFEENLVDEDEGEVPELSERLGFVDEEDEGSAETFFAWFFRGKGPPGFLSGAAFQKNRLNSTSSAYATLFEDDHVSWLLNYPADLIGTLTKLRTSSRTQITEVLRNRAYAVFLERSGQKDGYPRLYVFEAYQVAGLQFIEEAGGDLGDKARVILDERYPGFSLRSESAPSGFPYPNDALGITTFFTELVRRPKLRDQIWPSDPSAEFQQEFRRREQRRELLSAMARLGASYIDLYLLAIRSVDSFSLRVEASNIRPDENLAREFSDLLESQISKPGFHSFYELSNSAHHFDLLLAANFPEVPSTLLKELASVYGATLQRQAPVGRMSGGVNKRLVKQFRMPGFPLVLITTNVLQEGEDLHTFCGRVIHYGITWTPSAMEQRTGRVDRIGSLVQRRLDGLSEEPPAYDWLQVYYPHLQDTVEVLQVRRVLKRLNRFLRLMHRGLNEGAGGSRIDTTRDMLERLEDIKPIEGSLESAFPVRKEWLDGEFGEEAIRHSDVNAELDYFAELWHGLAQRDEIQALQSRARRIKDGRLVVKSDGPYQVAQKFKLEIRSQAAGDSFLLRCVSDVGAMKLNDKDILDDLYKLQRDLGLVKICIYPDANKHEHHVTVEEEIIFDRETTQIEEVVRIVKETTIRAYWIHKLLIANEGTWPENGKPARESSDQILEHIDALIRRRHFPWTREGHSVKVELSPNGRSHVVQVDRRGDNYIFSSLVVDAKQVTQSDSYWRELAHRAWRRNAVKELITFAFDERDRLIGFIAQPVATLDQKELTLYIDTVAKECDRFEYILTGLDKV